MTSLVAEAVQAELGARERWPNNVKLYEPYQAEQIILPDYANCLSVRTFLKMCNAPFTRELRTNAEEMSPSGSVPFLQVGAFIVAEFDPIVAFAGLRGFSLNTDLSETERSELRAYCAMVSSILGRAEVTQTRVGSVHPWPLNWMIPMLKKSEVKSHLKSVGWADKSLEDVLDEIKSCCQALSERLEQQKYFFGDSPTELDALVFGHLFSLLTIELPLVNIAGNIREFVNLTNFCQRIEDKYFKEKEDD
ncbi:metaxin-2-like isoform X2 [Saccostrea echinata]|uniref:metaxin-2-like isoform X2 n=1 Tax=Saccostrea echinata TaxID=191078 RepID=UPI002A8141C8|nr:metaxin-2-like isoform X2 [Saccostrea echinata]